MLESIRSLGTENIHRTAYTQVIVIFDEAHLNLNVSSYPVEGMSD